MERYKVEAVIFDLNGVIIKPVTEKLEIINSIFNVSLSYKEIYSLWYPVYLKASLGKISVTEFWQILAKKILPSYIVTGAEDNIFLKEMELKEDNISELLTYLKSKYKLALLSNFVKEWAWMLLSKFKLDKYFEKVLISSEIGKRKPCQELYQRICDLIGVSPQKSVYIADEEEDLAIPQKMGMLPVFIPGEDNFSKIGITVPSLKEIKNIL